MSDDKPQEVKIGWSGNPWDQQPGEPDVWYGRFKVYLELGPTRSVLALDARYPKGQAAVGETQ